MTFSGKPLGLVRALLFFDLIMFIALLLLACNAELYSHGSALWLSSTVQMQDEEILRLNAELEHSVRREMELRNRLEQSLLTLQIVERDLQAADKELRSQLDHSLQLLRKAENDVRVAESRIAQIEKQKESLEARNREKDLELKSCHAMFHEKDIVILKQGEELKQGAATRQKLMKELEQMEAQAKLMAQMRDELSRLRADLDSAEAKKAELLKETDYLSGIAMQMTQKIAEHEKEEAAAEMQRKHAGRLAAKNRKKHGFAALLLHFHVRNGLRTLCNLMSAKCRDESVQHVELQMIWSSWHLATRARRRLGNVCDRVHANRAAVMKRMICQIVMFIWHKCAAKTATALRLEQRRMQRVQLMEGLWMCRKLGAVFCAWRTTIQHLKAQLVDMWNEEARKNRRLEHHLQQRACRSAGLCLHLWHTYTAHEMMISAEKARKNRLLERHLLRRRKATSRLCFDSWHNHTVDETNQIASISRMILQMIERSLVFAFQQWRQNAQEQKIHDLRRGTEEARHNRLLERHLKKKRKATSCSCLKAWRNHTVNEMGIAASISKMMLQMIERSLAFAFQQWRQNAQEQKIHDLRRGTEEARHNRLLERHLKKKRKATSCSCLKAWRNHTVNEMGIAASISKMMLQMNERLLAFAFQQWRQNAQEQKRNRDHLELTNRCTQAENDLEQCQSLLALSDKRHAATNVFLHAAESSVDALIQASAKCAAALEAGRVKNFQRIAYLENQLVELLKVSSQSISAKESAMDQMRQKYEAEQRELLCSITAKESVIDQMRHTHAAEQKELRCIFEADMSHRILEVDALLHETYESKIAIQAPIEKMVARLERVTDEFAKLVATRDRLQEALSMETQRCADLDALCKREEKDCHDLEKALDDVSRRLLQAENKLERVEAQNHELRNNLAFVEEAQARLKTLETYNEELLARLAQSSQRFSSGEDDGKVSTWGVGAFALSVQQNSSAAGQNLLSLFSPLKLASVGAQNDNEHELRISSAPKLATCVPKLDVDMLTDLQSKLESIDEEADCCPPSVGDQQEEESCKDSMADVERIGVCLDNGQSDYASHVNVESDGFEARPASLQGDHWLGSG